MPYAGVMNLHATAEQHGRGEPVGRSGLLNVITPAFGAEIAALLRSGSVHLVQLRSLGGATADVPPDATAFAHREAPATLERLRTLKRELDPGNLFRDNFNIDPAAAAPVTAMRA